MSYEISIPTEGSNRSLRYKYQRLRERLREAIAEGELSGKLPGERELARRYRANAKTVNKALSDLTTEGLLLRQVGRGTFVAGGGADRVDRRVLSRRFGWLAPSGPEHAFREPYFLRAAKLLGERGHRLEKLVVPLPGDGRSGEGRPGETVIPPGRLRGLAGVLICCSNLSTELLADLHRRHLPAVTINHRHPRIKTLTVITDYAQGGFELSEQMIRLGHRDIRLLIAPELLPGASSAETGYRSAMQRHGLRAHEALTVEPGGDWAAMLRGADRPSGLICVGGSMAVEATDRAVDAGLTTPAMLSISALPEPGDLLPAERSITAYEADPETLVDWASDLLLTAAPGRLPRTVVVPGTLTDRGSAAPPINGDRTERRLPSEAVV